jgi:hypothetical protein
MIHGGAMEAAEKLRKYQVKTNKDNRFDIDLDFGVHYEKSLAKILSLGKVEVKTERDKWKETRNIAIELTCNGKDSGIKVTEAQWWAHILTWKGDVVSVILLPVDKLKKIVKKSVKHGDGRIVMGGDNNASEIALIPLEDMANGF